MIIYIRQHNSNSGVGHKASDNSLRQVISLWGEASIAGSQGPGGEDRGTCRGRYVDWPSDSGWLGGFPGIPDRRG